MNTPSLPIYNWSINKLLLTEEDTFNKAKIKILFTILLFSMAKILIVIFVASFHNQYYQLERASVALVIYTVLMKLLLINKQYIIGITHALLWCGMGIIYSNVFVFVKAINIITLQFVYMAIISSFYLLNKRSGIIYSCIAILPILISLLLSESYPIQLAIPASELAISGALLVIILNFVTIIVSEYLFQKAFSINIAEKETLNTKLKESVEEAKRLAQSKSDFLSTMSHELRTPLNSVIGMADLLSDSPYNEDQKENLDILKFSATSLQAVVNDILDFNKLDSNKLHLETISVNIAELIKSSCSGLSVQAKEKGLPLIVDIDEALNNLYVITDPTRITQILYNLIGNSIKFSSKGDIHVSLKLIKKDANNATFLFSVKDRGIGISADKHQSIFEPFVQASTNTARNFGGTGLGLPIVKRLLGLFNSDIHLESTPNVGSHFFFEITLPIDKKPVINTPITTNSIYDLTGLRVLVAEDNVMNVLLIQKLFAKWNIEPDVATNGLEALSKMQSNKYDVILMDIHMPEMDGYEAAKKIRALSDSALATIPIIALTASVSYNLENHVKEAGMNDYLHKPFDANELYNKLKRLVPK